MKKILVIDDAEFILESTSTLLEFEGYEVFTASNGEIGFNIAMEIIPDMIICDISMPKMNGYAVLDKIRNSTQLSTVPFIFLTAFTEKVNMRTGMEKGADDYIIKPFTREELIAAIDAQWNKHKLFEDRVQKKVDEVGKNVTYALPHEFRTVLNEVIGSAKFLNSAANTISVEETKEIATDIIESSNRLLKITENFLIYVNIEAFVTNPLKKLQLRTYITEEPVTILKDTAIDLSKKYGRIDDFLIANLPEKTIIEMSQESYSKLIYELIDNAFRFSEPGEKVTVEFKKDINFLNITIKDEGRGMTLSQINNIAALTQFDRAVYEQQGVGLGLIVAKRLIEIHDGKFEISQNKNKGTIVTFNIPIRKF
jgi:two-component system, sensor histidine kinase and response regulator